MARTRTAPRSKRAPRASRPAVGGALVRREWLWVALLLLVHLGLVLWGAARNSVTFDENFHLPAGVLIAARGEFRVSAVNPPLVKFLCALPALAAGARLPTAAALANGEQGVVGESFMRVNAAHYQRVFFAARCVVSLLSVLLGFLVWRFARRLYGARGGLLALGFYVFAPEALAHGGLVTMDLATGLGLFASVYAFWGFARSGRWEWWWGTALAVGLTFLTRFTALLLAPVLLVLALLVSFGRRARRPARLWLGLLLLVPSTLLVIDAGYLGRTSLEPLREWRFESRPFRALQRTLPALRLPLPDAYVGGLDRQAVESRAGTTPTYLLGRLHRGPVPYYFPLALAFKWPLGFLAALLARAAFASASRAGRRRARHELFLAVPVAAELAAGMLANLNIGVRYLFPLLPFLCVWLGGLGVLPRVLPRVRMARVTWARVALGLALLQAVETSAAAPWYLAFFNRLAGGPGGGYRLINDSNVDWGQGLIALREEMKRRGIERIHLAYHGTVDPAVYGIDYLPYLGGVPGPESEWIAVSSYYFVGLSQRMMTQHGRVGPLSLDFRLLWGTRPDATPAHCMFLFHLQR